MVERSRVVEEYQTFASAYAQGSSALYEELAQGVIGDPEVLDLLLSLPVAKRHPTLLFASARLVAGTPSSYAEFRSGLLRHRDTIVNTMLSRRTQTNEPARCAALYPVLAALPQPVALIEVGASAGLCLLPDRYRYDYHGSGRAGSGADRCVAGDPTSPVTVGCTVEGPWSSPGPLSVAWRAGIDLAPVDISDPDRTRWLELLVWPEHDERLARLQAALAVARRDPPRIVAGDANERLAEVAAQAPTETTLVVFHTAVLSYVPRRDRQRLADQVRSLGAHWLSQEDPERTPWITAPTPPRPGMYLVALNGRPLAFSMPHGGWVSWLVDPAQLSW